jgi:hypothetical protein
VEKILPTEKRESGQALYWSVVGGQKDVIGWLFEKYGRECSKDIKSYDAGPKGVLAAARNGHEESVQELIKGLIKIDKDAFSLRDETDENFETWTPLHWAITYRPAAALDAVRHMLMNGADPDKTIKDGISATDMAEALKGRCSWTRRYREILALLESPLRVPRKPIQLVEPTDCVRCSIPIL